MEWGRGELGKEKFFITSSCFPFELELYSQSDFRQNYLFYCYCFLQPATLALARPTRSISTIYSILLHMRLNPNPLPVTKAKGHHCHQIPATFLRCCVQQWDEVYPHLSSTPTDHAAFGPNLSHSKENCTIHCFLQGKLLYSFYKGKWDLQDTRTTWVILQVRQTAFRNNSFTGNEAHDKCVDI